MTNKRITTLTPILFIGILIGSCAPTRFVKPIEHKKHVISANLGGPIITIPGVATMPIPFTSVGYGYGLKPKTTLFGNWHTTAAVFGVIQFDCGVSQLLWKNDKMGVSVSPSLNFFSDVYEKNTQLYPQIDANYYFDYYRKEKKGRVNQNYFYGGFSNWFQLQSKAAHGLDLKNRMIFSPQLGHVFERGKWNYTLEVKFLAPYLSNQNIVVDYVSPFGKRGAMGAYFGLNYKL